MRRLVSISIFLAVFLVTSCGSPSETSEPEASGTMVAVIDGTRWQGELMAENKALRKGVEVHDDADKILAGNVASGGRLRSRLLARAGRGLPESDSLGGTPTLPGP